MNLPGFYPSVYIEKVLYALSWTRLDHCVRVDNTQTNGTLDSFLLSQMLLGEPIFSCESYVGLNIHELQRTPNTRVT